MMMVASLVVASLSHANLVIFFALSLVLVGSLSLQGPFGRCRDIPGRGSGGQRHRADQLDGHGRRRLCRALYDGADARDHRRLRGRRGSARDRPNTHRRNRADPGTCALTTCQGEGGRRSRSREYQRTKLSSPRRLKLMGCEAPARARPSLPSTPAPGRPRPGLRPDDGAARSSLCRCGKGAAAATPAPPSLSRARPETPAPCGEQNSAASAIAATRRPANDPSGPPPAALPDGRNRSGHGASPRPGALCGRADGPARDATAIRPSTAWLTSESATRK